MAAIEYAPPREVVGTHRGCEGCKHYRGVAWIGEVMRIRCALSNLTGGYADRHVKDYIGCGLWRPDGDRQRELW